MYVKLVTKKISFAKLYFANSEMIAKESKIHSYGRSFNGFVAKLLPHEATRLAGT